MYIRFGEISHLNNFVKIVSRVLAKVVSLGNWYSTFRENPLVSYPRLEILNNISLHEDVCASLFRNVGN
jgi:hypothetical protein